MKPDIIKIAALVVREGKLLITKTVKQDIWISLGGTLEKAEDELECLRRELEEEIKVKVVGEPKFYLKSPIEEAVHNPGKTVQITVYLTEIEGEPTPSMEVEKIHWLTKAEFEAGVFKLGSVLQEYAVPKLIEDGLMY
jgi:8-oxo-dGTP diphosphatase